MPITKLAAFLELVFISLNYPYLLFIFEQSANTFVTFNPVVCVSEHLTFITFVCC